MSNADYLVTGHDESGHHRFSIFIRFFPHVHRIADLHVLLALHPHVHERFTPVTGIRTEECLIIQSIKKIIINNHK